MDNKYTGQTQSLAGLSIRCTYDKCKKVCYKGEECSLWEKPLYCPADGHILEHTKQAMNIFVKPGRGDRKWK